MKVILELPPGLTLEHLQALVNDRIRDLNSALADKIESPAGKNLDLGTHRLINVADPANDLDAVNLRTLKHATAEQVQTVAGTGEASTTAGAYSMVFSGAGAMSAGASLPGYPLTVLREGIPFEASFMVRIAPTVDAKINFSLYGNGYNGDLVLANPLTLPAGELGPVTSTDLAITDKLLEGTKVFPEIIASGGAEIYTMKLDVKLT